MKLRCTNNSIRLRLRKSEVEQLQTKPVKEGMNFPDGSRFDFTLLIDDKVEMPAAGWVKQELKISIPTEKGLHWINSQEVGIEHHVALPNGQQLHLLIEKDFPCIGRDEDKSDFFGELTDGAVC